MKRSEFLRRDALGTLAAFLPVPALAKVAAQESAPATTLTEPVTVSRLWAASAATYSGSMLITDLEADPSAFLRMMEQVSGVGKFEPKYNWLGA